MSFQTHKLILVLRENWGAGWGVDGGPYRAAGTLEEALADARQRFENWVKETRRLEAPKGGFRAVRISED